MTALSDADGSTVLNDFDREAEVARIAGFDYDLRLVYGMAAEQRHEILSTVEY